MQVIHLTHMKVRYINQISSITHVQVVHLTHVKVKYPNKINWFTHVKVNKTRLWFKYEMKSKVTTYFFFKTKYRTK